MAQTEGVTYDVAVIHEFAQQLYRKAGRREKQGVVLGFLAGLLLAVSLVGAASLDTVLGRWPAIIISFIIVAASCWLGLKFGLSAALRLKLEAQLALCQAEMEKNSRRR